MHILVTSIPIFGRNQLLSEESWNSQLKENRWLSQKIKRGLIGGGRGYGAYRLSEMEMRLDDVIEMSPGTYRGSVKPAKLIIDAAKRAMDDGYTEYAFGSGLKEFRIAIAEKLMREKNMKFNPDTEITATSGCTHAFNMTMDILIDPGDEILMIDPDYVLYWRRIEEYGAKAVPVPLKDPNILESPWTFDVAELEKRISPKTKMFVFSNGNNPCGRIFSKKELESIAEIAIRKDIYVFADELYEKLTFDGHQHYSIASIPGMAERTITAMGFSKVPAMSGFRVGYVLANKEVISQMKQEVAHSVECVNSVGQMAAIAAMSEEMNEWYNEIRKELQMRRDYTVGKLNSIPGIVCSKPVGSFFLFPNISRLGTSQAVAEFLLREAKVKVPVGTGFGPVNGEGHIRITFAAPWDRLARGLERIASAAAKLRVEQK